MTELSEFEQKLIGAWRNYEAECDLEKQSDLLDELIGVLAERLNTDGWDSVWYARMVDRVNHRAYFSSSRAADDCTFVGLAHFLNRWAENTNPPAVVVDRD